METITLWSDYKIKDYTIPEWHTMDSCPHTEGIIIKEVPANQVLWLMNIIGETMADGPGIRNSVYCSGCHHACPGCHNPETWVKEHGKIFMVKDVASLLTTDQYADVTFSGGDPMYQVDAFTELAILLKEAHKNIWMYTGFVYEDIIKDEHMKKILPYIDALVDGPFIMAKRNTKLLFKGSENQRILMLNHGIVQGTYEEYVKHQI